MFNVLAFTAIAAFAAALIFGVLPAWKASRPNVIDVLRSSGRLVGGASGRWLRDGAVVAEVALAFVLLVGSGLMIRTFLALKNTNPGFDPNGVLTFAGPSERAPTRTRSWPPFAMRWRSRIPAFCSPKCGRGRHTSMKRLRQPASRSS